MGIIPTTCVRIGIKPLTSLTKEGTDLNDLENCYEAAV